MKKIISVILLAFLYVPYSNAACLPFTVVCGVKHGHKNSTHRSKWGIGHHNEKYSNLACRPTGGNHCGSHHTLNYKDMPHNAAKHKGAAYKRSVGRKTDYCSVLGKKGNIFEGDKVLNDPVSTMWGKVFAAACHVHDICYSTLGMKKSSCDRELKKNINQICKKLPRNVNGFKRDSAISGTWCRVENKMMTHQLTTLFMQGAYDDGQEWAKKEANKK